MLTSVAELLQLLGMVRLESHALLEEVKQQQARGLAVGQLRGSQGPGTTRRGRDNSGRSIAARSRAVEAGPLTRAFLLSNARYSGFTSRSEMIAEEDALIAPASPPP